MFIDKSMMTQLQARMEAGDQTALLIIDEEENAAPGERSNTPGTVVVNSNITACQQRLLMYMQRMQRPIWSIRFLQNFPAEYGGSNDNTRVPLRGLYNGTERVMRKPHPNAFKDTTLAHDLQQAGVTRLVIMGWNANACVQATVGNPYWTQGMDDGATHLGFTVMTCDEVLHGGPANWSHLDWPEHFARLEFYARF